MKKALFLLLTAVSVLALGSAAMAAVYAGSLPNTINAGSELSSRLPVGSGNVGSELSSRLPVGSGNVGSELSSRLPVGSGNVGSELSGRF
jgi:hypothetical protein